MTAFHPEQLPTNLFLKDQPVITSNYRMSVSSFHTLNPSEQPHVATLTEKKNSSEFTDMGSVRGQSKSGIEKMTHPLAQSNERDYLSPYMIDILGDTTTLAFAEKTLQAPRQRLLDTLGIDDTQKNLRQAELRMDQQAISRFYTHPTDAQPMRITLNGKDFLEQPPTSPYFKDQKIITPDYGFFRNNQSLHKLDLLNCKTRDDSELFFDKEPVIKLQEDNQQLFLNESNLRTEGKTLNTTHYFVEMMEYLEQRGNPGDFIVQNSLETSSDKNTPHFQFIPGDVPLPIYSHGPQTSGISGAQIVDWHLPSIYSTIDLQQFDWRDTATQLQHRCQELLESQQLSTTPIFRKREDGQIESWLIFKKDCSDQWNMESKEILNAPGWLEASGVFIANSTKAETFSTVGADTYYASYCVPTEKIDAIKRIFQAGTPMIIA
jgi:hypothetical protein